MTKPDPAEQPQETRLEKAAGETFSSEKREDIWAIIIAVGIFVLAVTFPEQLENFFNKTLYLF